MDTKNRGKIVWNQSPDLLYYKIVNTKDHLHLQFVPANTTPKIVKQFAFFKADNTKLNGMKPIENYDNRRTKLRKTINFNSKIFFKRIIFPVYKTKKYFDIFE